MRRGAVELLRAVLPMPTRLAAFPWGRAELDSAGLLSEDVAR